MTIELPFINKVTTKDKAFLARQLATMLESGVSIDKAISIIINQTKHPRLKKILSEVLTAIEAGSPLSDAFKKHPDAFDKIFISVVISGEAVGRLAEVLKQLSIQLTKQSSFVSQIKTAFYYPVFVLVTMVIIVAIMIIKVIPPLKEIFAEFETKLPWTTESLLTISDFMASYWWIIVLIIILLVIVVKYYLATTNGQYLLARAQIGFPTGIGKDVYMTRFTQTLAMLVHAGTPIIKSLNIAAEAMNNVIYKDSLKFAANQMERGIPLSVPLDKDKNFDILVPQMINVGEQTGQLDKVLENLAEYFEEQSGSKIKNANALIEPILIIVIGLGVTFIVFSIIMPIYQLAQMQ